MTKIQNPNRERGVRSALFWSLKIGVWYLFVIWCLGFGILGGRQCVYLAKLEEIADGEY